MNPNMIISTPGRLESHLKEGDINLDNLDMLAIDECDDILSTRTKPGTMQYVLSKCRKKCQKILVSATLKGSRLEEHMHDLYLNMDLNRKLSIPPNSNRNFQMHLTHLLQL